MNGIEEKNRAGYLPLDDETLWGTDEAVEVPACPIAIANSGLCPSDCMECTGLDFI